MKCISLIGTVHAEVGYATIPALCSILEQIRPEVIFLEIPRDGVLEQYLNGGTTNDLESAAVKHYCAGTNAKLVAVDLPTPKADFFDNYNHLQREVHGRSSDYRRLTTWEKNYVLDYGFVYLNADRCGEMWRDIDAAMRATVEALKDPRLVAILEEWNRINDLRETEWLKCILKYCEEESFEKGAFLVGAAHRQSIISKSKELFSGLADSVQWDFSSAVGYAAQIQQQSASNVG